MCGGGGAGEAGVNLALNYTIDPCFKIKVTWALGWRPGSHMNDEPENERFFCRPTAKQWLLGNLVPSLLGSTSRAALQMGVRGGMTGYVQVDWSMREPPEVWGGGQEAIIKV